MHLPTSFLQNLSFCVSDYVLDQGFSSYGSQPQMGLRNVILGSRNKLA